MSTVKVTCEDGKTTRIYIDGEPVKHATALSLGLDTRQREPVIVIEEAPSLYRRTTTEYHMASFTLVAETEAE